MKSCFDNCIKGFLVVCAVVCAVTSCKPKKPSVEYTGGQVKVSIAAGEEWLFNPPKSTGLGRKNPPQIAIWVEDAKGRYLSTIYVSEKMASCKWDKSSVNHRNEALPVWCFVSGHASGDSLILPTRRQPVTDAVTGATPTGSFDVGYSPMDDIDRFIVKIEVNHCGDFNASYPQDAVIGERNYSRVSGQPSLLYMATVDRTRGVNSFKARLFGHGPADGSEFVIYTDNSGIDSALKIVDEITVTLQ